MSVTSLYDKAYSCASKVLDLLEFVLKNKHPPRRLGSSTYPPPAPMPIARCSLRCGSSNAFRPQAALWNLFLEQQQPLNLPNARRLSLRHRSLQDAQSAVEISPNSEKRSGNPASIPPSEYINTASLRGSLQALRAKNRDKFLGQDIPSSDNTYSNGNAHAIPITRVPYGPKLSSQKRPKDTFSERNEVDILFEGRQFDLNKFSFPQQKNFERPSFEESHNGPSKGKAEIIAKNKTTHNEAELMEYEGLYVRPSMGEAKSNHDFPWTKDIPSEIYGRKR
jgi:hypothetical protein